MDVFALHSYFDIILINKQFFCMGLSGAYLDKIHRGMQIL